MLIELMGEKRGACRVLVRNMKKKKDHFEDLGVDERMILKWMFIKYNKGEWAGLSWVGIGTNGRLL